MSPYIKFGQLLIVEKAWCTCMAGLGLSCSHVGALLWKIEYAARNNMTGVSCTDETARWNKGMSERLPSKQCYCPEQQNVKFCPHYHFESNCNFVNS
jgi:hypothetical protein